MGFNSAFKELIKTNHVDVTRDPTAADEKCLQNLSQQSLLATDHKEGLVET
jgi:c-di-GMP-related signal transduction protein